MISYGLFKPVKVKKSLENYANIKWQLMQAIALTTLFSKTCCDAPTKFISFYDFAKPGILIRDTR